MATKVNRGEATTSAIKRGAVLEDARRAGLLDGDKTEHISFRAPRALERREG